MKSVLFVSSEAFPFVKTGGLGDVAGSLPAALAAQGFDLRVLLPGYPAALSRAQEFGCYQLTQLKIQGQRLSIVETVVPGSGVTTWLLDCPALFGRPGNPYLDDTGRPWQDNHLRFAALCRAAVELAMDRADLGWQADIVHCNDWQTGLVPALLSLELHRPASVFTLHNLAYQGLFPYSHFEQLRLPATLWHFQSLEYYGQMSFIKGGLAHADRINTVSPTYAEEIQTAEFGYGLDALLRDRHEALSGIINGIDIDTWNPATDPHLVQNYDRHSLDKKTLNKVELLRDYHLQADDSAPLTAFIGRLVEQKGVDLILKAIPGLIQAGTRLIVLGSGEAHFEQALQAMAARYPVQFALIVGYDESLAHRLEAGADIFLMPSRFEPCGLNQLYSQRYGTIPVVHRCGGLADTVVDCDSTNLEAGDANGFVFERPDNSDLLHAMHRALSAFQDTGLWRRLQLNGMTRDLSWGRSALAYQQLYQDACTAAALEKIK